MKLLPIKDKWVNKLIKTYYNFSPYLNKKKKKLSRLRIRFKRLSTNRIFVSKALMKHANNKIIITLYTYNRQINNINRKKKLKKTIKKIYLKKLRNNIRYK